MAKSPKYRFRYDVRKRYCGIDTRDTLIVVTVIAETQDEAERKALAVAKKDCSNSYKFNADLLEIEEV